MNSKDLICCANRAEELRKALHRKIKISRYDCKAYRMGMLTVLHNLGFITDQDEYMNIENKAGAWDKELKSESEETK